VEKTLQSEFAGPTAFGHPKGLMTLFFTEMWSASVITACVPY
jgi:POT family proton-dependent oligopeptide transporter